MSEDVDRLEMTNDGPVLLSTTEVKMEVIMEQLRIQLKDLKRNNVIR